VTAAEWWRQIHEELAAKIEAGEPLSRQDARRAAAAIRRDAANPPGPPAQARGRPSTLPADDARMLFDALREEPEVWSVERAIGYIAEVFDAPESTVRDAVYRRRGDRPSR
jgi:hypothetical protein